MTVQDDRETSLAGLRVLIVEDEALIAMEIEDLLRSLQAETLGPVPTVRAALDALAAERPDAAALDLNLRGERSTPVAAALREAGTPFVLVTGYAGGHIDEPALRDAPRVPKPVEAAELARALRRSLSRG